MATMTTKPKVRTITCQDWRGTIQHTAVSEAYLHLYGLLVEQHAVTQKWQVIEITPSSLVLHACGSLKLEYRLSGAAEDMRPLVLLVLHAARLRGTPLPGERALARQLQAHLYSAHTLRKWTKRREAPHMPLLYASIGMSPGRQKFYDSWAWKGALMGMDDGNMRSVKRYLL